MLGSLSYKVNFKYLLERKNAGIKAIGTKHFKFIKPKIQKLTMFPKGHKKQQKKKRMTTLTIPRIILLVSLLQGIYHMLWYDLINYPITKTLKLF